jgi:hypothetical protein
LAFIIRIYHDAQSSECQNQLLVYADDLNTLGGSANTTKKNTGNLVGASKENGVEVNADKSKNMAMSRDQNGDEVTI